METNDQDEVIVDDVEETNEEVTENTEETTKVEKPKRTPQEEYSCTPRRARGSFLVSSSRGVCNCNAARRSSEGNGTLDHTM